MNSARGKKATKLDQQRINDEHAQITAINKAQPVSQYDMDGIVLEVNQSFEQLLGYGRDEARRIDGRSAADHGMPRQNFGLSCIGKPIQKPRYARD